MDLRVALRRPDDAAAVVAVLPPRLGVGTGEERLGGGACWNPCMTEIYLHFICAQYGQLTHLKGHACRWGGSCSRWGGERPCAVAVGQQPRFDQRAPRLRLLLRLAAKSLELCLRLRPFASQ